MTSTKNLFQFLYYTNCINLSIRFVYPSVWRKKIRSTWVNLNFNVRASGRKSKHTCFSKASAKVLLFFDMTKYFSKKMHLKMHFLRNCLIFSIYYFGLFLQSTVINGAKMVEQAFLRENAPLYIYIIRNARVRIYRETKRGDFRRNHLLCAG